MARSGSLSRRIERLLNDVSFRQAFAGSRRTLAAVLVVPVALFAATALVRVQAAGQQAPEPPAPAVAPAGGAPTAPPAVAPVEPTSGVSQPEPVIGDPAPAAPAEVAPSPARASAPEVHGPAPLPAPKILAVTPASPASPARLAILPAVAAKAMLTLIAPKAPGMPGTMIMVSPNAPTLALIAPRAGYGGSAYAVDGYGTGVGYGTAQSATSEAEPQVIATMASTPDITTPTHQMASRTR